MRTLFENYMRGMTELELMSASGAAMAKALGIPVDDGASDTASVRYDRDKKSVVFSMSNEFIDPLTDSELAGLLVHESLHVVFHHLDEAMDDSRYPRKDILTIAHEVLINDRIPHQFGVSLPKVGAFGPALYDHDFSAMETKESYDFIVKRMPEGDDTLKSIMDLLSQMGAGGASGSGSTHGSVQGAQKGAGGVSDGSLSSPSTSAGQEGGSSAKGDSVPAESKSGEDSKSNAGGQSDGEQDAPKSISDLLGCGGVKGSEEDALQITKQVIGRINISDVNAAEVGNDIMDALVDALLDNGGSVDSMSDHVSGPPPQPYYMNWERLLAKIDPRVTKPASAQSEAKWTQPNRRYMYGYPDVIMPTVVADSRFDGKDRGEKTHIIFALDFSCSIPEHIVDHMHALAESVPLDIMVPTVVTWSDSVVVYDDHKRTVERGFTKFGNLRRWVKNYEKKNGHDAYVVCVTDGGYYEFAKGAEKMHEDKFWHFVTVKSSDLSVLKRNGHKNVHLHSDYVDW